MSFSGGKDSTYMLLEMIRRNMPIDLVLNADTGMEFPAMYEHIDRIDDHLYAERGIRITRLKSSKSFEDLMFDAVREGGREYSNRTGYGWPGIFVRWCTGCLKTHLIGQFLRPLPLEPYQYVAFAADEAYRLERKNNQGEFRRHPLLDWGITEAEALAGCYQAGYTWGGLYEHFSRVSCWCCPLQNLDELRALWELYPDVWAKLRDLDDRAIAQFGRNDPLGQFRKNESVRMLELRFALEQEWKKRGGNIRNRAFFATLHELYRENFNAAYLADAIPKPKKKHTQFHER